jgi:isoleucyl-tRNA synthetase
VDDLHSEAIVTRKDLNWFDKLACDVTDDWVTRVHALLKTYRLHDAYLEIIRFEGEDLSSFYLDALKDRLYTSAPDSQRRRSAQSAVLHILTQFLAVIAPVLSFTAEEAWQSLPATLRGDRASVFDLTFAGAKHANAESAAAWQKLKELRSWVAASEGKRDYELQAQLTLPQTWYDRFAPHEDEVREALVVSAITLHADSTLGEDAIKRSLSTAEGDKCQRCWKYLPLGVDARHPTLCSSCAEVVKGLE